VEPSFYSPTLQSRRGMLGGKTCAESSGAQDEAPAIAHGVETPPLAAVRVNILRVPASRAEDLDGIVAA
jgi:hypothetical protein